MTFAVERAGNPLLGTSRRRKLCAAVTITAVLCAAAVGATVAARPAGAVDVYPAPTSGTWTVVGHGNGHGHGMSQYGARGAAARGLTAAQIVGFYYPNTTLTTAAERTVRVLLSGSTSSVPVAAAAGTTLSWPGGSVALPAVAGADQWRLVASGTGLAAQYHVAAGWKAYRAGLPAQADFGRAAGVTYYGNGAATAYRGSVGAIRSGASVLPINRLPLDSYVMGVVPNEMPASWAPAAVQSQAIAARTYARYAVEHNAGSPYDICDTTQCQVYGGLSSEQPASNAAVSATAHQIVSYGGAAAFTQFSADDGGWTTDGGQPYLVARADPYEQYANSPWFSWTRTVGTSDVAAAYGLRSVTQIKVLSRDGHGDWGGRVLTAEVDGISAAGAPVAVSTSGYALTSAMNLPHQWFTLQQSLPSAPLSVHSSVGDGTATVTWQPPTTSGSSAVTGYLVSATGLADRTLPASSRSVTLVGLANGAAATISVRAVSPVGRGAVTSVTVTPTASPSGLVALPTVRILDTRATHSRITPSTPYDLPVLGRGSIPASGVQSVLLSVAVLAPSSDGTLWISQTGEDRPVTSAYHFRRTGTVIVTAAVPVGATGRVHFAVSTGAVDVVVSQMGYQAAAGSPLRTTYPIRLGVPRSLDTVSGTPMQIAGRAGVPVGARLALIQLNASSFTTAPASLTVFADGTARPNGVQLGLDAHGVATDVLAVPLGADGAIRILSSRAGVGTSVTLLGYGAAGAVEHLEVTHQRPITDWTTGPQRAVTPAGTWFGATTSTAVPATSRSFYAQVTLVSPTSGTVTFTPSGGSAAQRVQVGYQAGIERTVGLWLIPGVRGGVVATSSSGTVTVGMAASAYLS